MRSCRLFSLGFYHNFLTDIRNRLHAFFVYNPVKRSHGTWDILMSMRIIFVRALRIVLLMSVFAFASCQETGYDFYSAIAGTVYDSSTGEPLENASVVLNLTNMTLQTVTFPEIG